MQRVVPWAVLRALAIGYVLSLSAVSAHAIRSPAWNFDVVGYVAAALSASESDVTRVHADTYRAILAVAPPDARSALIGSTEYRRTLRESPVALATQLPFYRCKAGYVALVSLLGHLGMNLARATYVVSALSYLALGALIISWFRRHAQPLVAWGLSFAFMLSPPIRELAGYSTPDLFAAVLLGLAAFLAIELSRFSASVGILLLACTVRPDNTLFAALLLAWLAYQGSSSAPRFQVALALCALCATWWSIDTATRAYPWGVLAKHTFVERLYQPSRMAERITTREYMEALAAGLHGKLVLAAFAALSLAAAAITRGRSHPPFVRKHRQVLLLAWLGIVAHYLCFPLLADRFFVYSYLLIAASATTLFDYAQRQGAVASN